MGNQNSFGDKRLTDLSEVKYVRKTDRTKVHQQVALIDVISSHHRQFRTLIRFTTVGRNMVLYLVLFCRNDIITGKPLKKRLLVEKNELYE